MRGRIRRLVFIYALCFIVPVIYSFSQIHTYIVYIHVELHGV